MSSHKQKSPKNKRGSENYSVPKLSDSDLDVEPRISSVKYSDMDIDARFSKGDIDDWHPPVGIRSNKKIG